MYWYSRSTVALHGKWLDPKTDGLLFPYLVCTVFFVVGSLCFYSAYSHPNIEPFLLSIGFCTPLVFLSITHYSWSASKFYHVTRVILCYGRKRDAINAKIEALRFIRELPIQEGEVCELRRIDRRIMRYGRLRDKVESVLVDLRKMRLEAKNEREEQDRKLKFYLTPQPPFSE